MNLAALNPFLERLQSPTPAGQRRICFSGKPGDSYFYDVLSEPVELLKHAVPFKWLTLINYTDQTADRYHHLNYATVENIRQVWEANRNEMFLLTGIPCFQPEYRPASQLVARVTNSRLPPMALMVNCGTDPHCCEGCERWVRILVQRRPGEAFKYDIHYPEGELIRQYVHSIIEQRGEAFPPTLQRTVELYTRTYPIEQPANPESPWLFLFLPHRLVGVLVSPRTSGWD